VNVTEVGKLLALMAIYDNRKAAEPDIAAWLKAIGDLPYADCEAAVISHYGSESTERIMPGHVRQRVRAMRSERLAREIMPAPPPGLTDNPGAYRAALRRRISEIADGMDIRLAIGGPLPGEPPPAWSEARKSLPPATPRPAVSDIALTQAEESRAARAVQETASEETGPVADRKAQPA
jgi:hypothetical protein